MPAFDPALDNSFQTLGLGNSSLCLRCVNKITQGEFAVKIYLRRQHDVLKDAQEGTWLREAKLLHDCQGHPNIVKLAAAFVDRYYVYLVMEPLSGGELWTRIRNRDEITESEAHHLFQQLASAVNHCHSRGVVHRDIKPSVSVALDLAILFTTNVSLFTLLRIEYHVPRSHRQQAQVD